jgi:hypothetical protein
MISPNITAPCEHDPKHHIRAGDKHPYFWVFRCEICGHENIKDIPPLLESEEKEDTVFQYDYELFSEPLFAFFTFFCAFSLIAAYAWIVYEVIKPWLN